LPTFSQIVEDLRSVNKKDLDRSSSVMLVASFIQEQRAERSAVEEEEKEGKTEEEKKQLKKEREKKEKKAKKKKKPLDNHKFHNIDANAYQALVR
jgi:hypothetical protein